MPRAWRIGLCALAVALGGGAPLATADFADFRALWVTRFEYNMSSPSSVNSIISNAADMGVTDVLFQVRGKADAYYDSNFEPRAERLVGSWDPLQTAIDAGAASGVKIHAWLNSMPLWRDTAAPVDGSHPFFNANPSFRRFDINGVAEDPTNQNGEYASANPILPEVHTHINNVVDDIVSNYAVDGVHLDYIRWIGNQNFNTLPHDAQSHQLFQQDTGLDASSSANAAAYRTYIKDRVTDLVGSVKNTIDAAEASSGRTVDLSAAVWRDPDIGENERLQDYRTWLENDLLDIAMPMIYLSDSNNHLLVPNLTNTLNIQSNTRIAPGLGAFLHTASGGGVQETIDQLDTLYDLGADGATFFSYSNFFGSDPLASQRRAAVIDYYDALVPPEPGPGNVIDDFEVDEGHFNWSWNISPGSQTFGLSSDTNIERVATEAQTGAGAQELNFVDSGAGTWQIRHNSGIGPGLNANPAGNVELPATGYVGMWLKTEDPGVSVEIALDDPDSAERGVPQTLTADGQWHLYQWNLEDDADWNGWIFGNGAIDQTTVTIDSIFFSGDGDAVVYMDNVSHNPLGPLAAGLLNGDFTGDGNVDGADLAVWQAGLGIAGGALNADGDATADGNVRGDDILIWQQNAAIASAAAAPVPEPASVVLATLATIVLVGRRPRDNWYF